MQPELSEGPSRLLFVELNAQIFANGHDSFDSHVFETEPTTDLFINPHES